MKAESLSAVMLGVLRNNRQVGKSLVEVYRSGTTRLIEKSLADRFGARGHKLGDILVKGVDKASDSAEAMMTRMCNRASSLVEKMDESKYAAKYLGLAGKAALPGAKIVRNLSGKLAARVASAPGAAGGGHRVKRVKRHAARSRSAAAA